MLFANFFSSILPVSFLSKNTDGNSNHFQNWFVASGTLALESDFASSQLSVDVSF